MLQQYQSGLKLYTNLTDIEQIHSLCDQLANVYKNDINYITVATTKT